MLYLSHFYVIIYHMELQLIPTDLGQKVDDVLEWGARISYCLFVGNAAHTEVKRTQTAAIKTLSLPLTAIEVKTSIVVNDL